MAAAAPSVGYLAVLRENRNFRRLWYGQVVSQLGDWLDNIALFTLLLNLTGSGQAVGLLFLAEFLPGAVVGPFAGVVVDRLPRRLVLIGADIGRALMVLLFLLVDSPSELWLLYLAVIGKYTLASFFEPARSAIIPSLCRREELVAANAISGATWSVMLAIGAAVGGLVAGTLGVQAAFLLDAVSFLVSAVLIATVRGGDAVRERASAAAASLASRVGAVLGELREGLRYIFASRELAWLTFTKGVWSLGAGVLLLLTLFGREVFPLGVDGALSIGLLYAARGVGAGIGPLLAIRLGGDSQAFMRRAIGLAIAVTGLGYMLLAGAPTLAVAALCVLLAHMGGSVQWVFSTALLQTRAADRLRGRVFSIEYTAMTLATALSAYAAGAARDAGASPQLIAVALGCVFVASGAVMGVALRRSVADV
jgi:MFS family permease